MKTVQQQFNEVFNSEYSKGVRDCLEGKPASSENKRYLEGYGDQYALEQIKSHESTKAI